VGLDVSKAKAADAVVHMKVFWNVVTDFVIGARYNEILQSFFPVQKAGS
jgi:hypothetical protein